MGELVVQKLRELNELADDVHWLCPRRAGHEGGVYFDEDVLASLPTESEATKSKRLEEVKGAEKRRDNVLEACTILAFDGEDARPYQDTFQDGLKRQLRRCEICVREYHRARGLLVQNLEAQFDGDEVRIFMDKFDRMNVDRIGSGLKEMTEALLDLPPDQRKLTAVSPEGMYALFEALNCVPFLNDREALELYFDQPFRLVQTNKKIKLPNFAPGMTAFLFSRNDERLNWALRAFSSVKRQLTASEFEHGVKPFLQAAAGRVLITNLDKNFLPAFWRGAKLIVSKLTKDLVSSHLRTLNSNIYTIGLEHFQIDFNHSSDLLASYQALITLSSTDFWTAMGSITPQAVVDTIFRAPSLQTLLKTDGEREPLQLEEKMDWTVQIITSVKPTALVAPLRIIADQLLHRLQNDPYSRYARTVCWEKGFTCVLRALQSVKEKVPGGPLVTDLIRLISQDLMQLIVQELDGIEKKKTEVEIEQTEIICLEIVEKALALDVSELARDRKHIMDKRTLDHELGTGNLNLWKMSMRHIKPGGAHLAASVLSGISGLLSLEKFATRQIEHAPKYTEAWNNALQRVLRYVCADLLQTLDEFHAENLDEVFSDFRASQGLIALLFNGDPDVHQAALNVLKVLGNEDNREDSIKHILASFQPQAMGAFNYALETITRYRVFEPSPIALKICTDVFNCLCNTTDGMLRSSKELHAHNLKELHTYWRRTWSLLGMIFEQTEPWSNHGYNKEMLQQFCRETMDLADHAFDQFAIFASTFQRVGGDRKAADVRAKLLQSPKAIFGYITRWLRLRDDYLIEKAVSLTRKMLGRLQEVEIRIDDDAAQYIENAVTSTERNNKIKTKLTMQQKATLQQALEKHLGVSLAVDVDALEEKPKKQLKMQDFTGSGRSSGSSTPISTSGKVSGKLDLAAWSDAAKRKKERQDVEDAEMQKLYGNFMSAQAAFKRRQAEEQQRKKSAVSKAVPKPPKDNSDFLAARRKAKEEQEQKRQAAIAKAKGVGVGSGVQGLGDMGKDHSLKGQNVMVSSDEESSDDEDELDADLFGRNPKRERRVQQRPDFEVKDAVGIKPDEKTGPTRIKRMQRNARDMRARLAPDLSSLHKTMLGWDFFHNGDYPPGSSEHQFREVAKAFQDPTTYQQTFQPLLTLEAWQGMVKAREENTNKPYELKVLNRTNVDSFIEFSSSIRHEENREMHLQEGDIVLVSKAKVKLTEDPSVPHALARVFRVKRQKAFNEIVYQTMPDSGIASSLVAQNTVYGVKVQSITPLEREYGALQGLQYYDLCMQILKAMPSPRIHLSDREIQNAQDIWNVNRAQSEAINAAMQNEGFSLIQGPPGSGKTKTIVAIVGGLLTQALSGSSGQGQRIAVPGQRAANPDIAAPPKKLLVCAPSNAAVDELVMRLKDGVTTKNGKPYPLNVVRIGRSDAINAQVMDVTMDELVAKKIGGNEADQKKREANQVIFKEHQEVSAKLTEARDKEQSGNVQGKESSELRDTIAALAKRKRELGVKIDNVKDAERNAGREADLNRKRAQQSVLDQAHVICATLSGSGHDVFQSLNIEFETVIIDEAAQCVEMSSLIPMKYGCVKCIMVGDPKQLPPTVFSKEAAKFQYEQSLFVRMQSNFPDVVYLLDTQYRMHPDISIFPSRSFYDGLLKDGNGMAGMRVRPWHASALLAPYRFFDVKGQHQSAPKGHSLVNYAEVDIAMALFERLTTDFRSYDYAGRVGVITPYKSQLKALKDKFSARFGSTIFDTIEFNTTDAFQGRESEIIIFSCVRASPAGGIGFLQDIRRMNVGLTRAKSSLWVLGNSESLMRGQWWKKLVVDAQARDAYSTGDLMSMLRQRSSAFPASGQTGAFMHDIGDHTSQMDRSADGSRRPLEAANGSPRAELSSTDVSRTQSATQHATSSGDNDRMDGIRYRPSDRIAHHKKQATPASDASSRRSTPATSEPADVEMSDADDGATAPNDETLLPRSNSAGTQVNGAGRAVSNKPRPALVPQANPPPVRKRPAPNPFMPKKQQRRP